MVRVPKGSFFSSTAEMGELDEDIGGLTQVQVLRTPIRSLVQPAVQVDGDPLSRIVAV